MAEMARRENDKSIRVEGHFISAFLMASNTPALEKFISVESGNTDQCQVRMPKVAEQEEAVHVHFTGSPKGHRLQHGGLRKAEGRHPSTQQK